ncbi:uncharacterized protein LOC117110682 [Anneissia japonica]|uniref:uncharacterized protein LOC117110682 n=1 Tax=Anneissia japonica TaxID=1529436 RepID=UPI001425B2D9|nr:uncharacterized protein LOC117110682 [Anneissia japonica]
MTEEQFETILNLIHDDIVKQDTRFRKAISPRERLSVCLRFLATGDSYGSFHYSYRMGILTVSMIIVEVRVAILERLSGIYMVMPSSPDEWEKLANDFYLRWNYPKSLGAIDGKRHIQAPNNSGSKYFCYKGHFSIVLLALDDANYCFTILMLATMVQQVTGVSSQEAHSRRQLIRAQ